MQENLQLTYINDQDDWYEFSLFEQYWSCLDDRDHASRSLMIQMFFVLGFTVLFTFAPFIDKNYLWISLVASAMFFINLFFDYFSGYDADYKNMKRLYENLRDHNIVNIYDEKLTVDFGDREINIRTDEYRRFFEWEDVEYIQETDNLIILRIRASNKKNLQGFQRLIISKRYIFPQKLEQLWALLNEKKAQYHIPQLLPDEVMNKLVLPTKERG